MISKRLKIGDRVKFTQEAKDRFEDSGYWKRANFVSLENGGRLDKTYTVLSVGGCGTWPNVFLGEGTAPHTPTYLLEPAETQKNKNMQKKGFILALVQALFPGYKLDYYAQSNQTTATVLNYPNKRGGTEDIPLTVRCSKNKNDDNSYVLVLTVPSSCTTVRAWENSDVEKVTEFLDKQCDLDCGENNIQIKNGNSLVMDFYDYPWHMVSEIKPLGQSPTEEEQVQALQAEIQQLKAENERLKAQTYTIEIPQGVTSICLNLKG